MIGRQMKVGLHEKSDFVASRAFSPTCKNTFERRASAVLLVLAMAFGIEHPTFAANDHGHAVARKLNNEGNVLFDLGKFNEAIRLFTDAYKAYPDPRILFNLAQAYRKLGDYERASELYSSVLRNSPDAPNRRDIEELLEETKAALAKQRAMSQEAPEKKRADAADAAPAIRPASSDLSDRRLPQLPTIVSHIEEQRTWYGNAVGWGLVGGGMVALSVGLWGLASANSLENQIPGAQDPELPGLRSDIRTRRTIGTFGVLTGGVSVLGGFAVFALTPKSVSHRIVPIEGIQVSLSGIQIFGRFR